VLEFGEASLALALHTNNFALFNLDLTSYLSAVFSELNIKKKQKDI